MYDLQIRARVLYSLCSSKWNLEAKELCSICSFGYDNAIIHGVEIVHYRLPRHHHHYYCYCYYYLLLNVIIHMCFDCLAAGEKTR